jgi:hypothetical protein
VVCRVKNKAPLATYIEGKQGVKKWENILEIMLSRGVLFVSAHMEPYFNGIQNEHYAKNICNYSVNVTSNKIVKIRMTASSSLDKLKNTTVSSTYAYDTYGNTTSASIDYGGGITETISNSYINNASETNYLLGFLTNTTKTTNRNGSSFVERNHIPESNIKGLPYLKRQIMMQHRLIFLFFMPTASNLEERV